MNARTSEALATTFTARQVDRKASASLVWQALKVGAQIAQYIVLARLVAPDEFGIFALAAAVFAVLSAINDGGLSTAAVTSARCDARLASNLWWTQALLGTLAALVMASSTPLLSLLFGVPTLQDIGLWLAPALLISSLGLQSKATLRRGMHVGRLAFVDIAGIVLGLACAWAASRYTGGVELLVICQLAAAAVTTCAACILAPVRIGAFAPDTDYRRAVRTGWHVAGSDLLNVMRTHVPNMINGLFLALADVGLFSRASQLINLPLAVLSPAIGNFLLPLLSRSREQPAAYHAHLQRTQRLFLAAAIPLSVWLAMRPNEFIVLVLGSPWAPVVPVLQCLTPLFVSQIISTIARVSLLASEYSRVDRTFAIWNLALTAVLVACAAPFGVLAVALALSLSAVFLRAPLLVYFAIRHGCIGLHMLLDALRSIGVLAAFSAVAVALARALPISPLHADLLSLFGCAAVTAVSLSTIVRKAGA